MGAAAELCLERHFDATRLNAIANHPDVRPTCGGDGQSHIDLSAFVAEPKNYALLWDHGAIVFQWTAPDTYEGHAMVLPEGRGADAYNIAREAVDYMAAQGAERLWARVAPGHCTLRHFITSAGFVRCGSDTVDIGFGLVTYAVYQWKSECLQH